MPISKLSPSSLLRDILATSIHRLSVAGCDTPRLDAEVLLAYSLGYQERSRLYLHLQDPLTEAQVNKLEVLLYRREQREPVAYLIGSKEFFGLDFQINPHVLIPRPETELLVEKALQIYKLQVTSYESSLPDRKSKIVNRKLQVVDVGTGSGCIAIALAKQLPEAVFFAVDLSPNALTLARQNAERHGVADRITFLLGDLLQPLESPVDLIVSNPPYVSRPELAAAQLEVRRYEPRLALDGGEDGLAVIRELLSHAKEKLNPGGGLLVEIGATQGQATAELAKRYFPAVNICIERDLAGLDRLLIVQF